LIEDGKISYIFNNQDLQKHKNFFLIRANIETAGNILRIIQKSTNGIKTENGTYEILNKRFAQYLRPDADLRYYQVFSNHSTMVYRLSGGIGMTYLNSVSMPFEKNFYAGGSNDLRAFSSRSLGPGSDTTSYSFERIGDIKINANIEYRYDILRILKGAFFIDAGNIWLRKFDANRIGADFNSSRFLSEVAIGSGIGFRFDFTFFIFRTDIGIPLRNPSYPKNERWFFNKLALRDLQLNLGIGYPF
jgi:outer membrane protein assembly factor BamA